MSTLVLTSEALGHKPGDSVTTFTAGEEAWLLSRGYAKKVGYTGVGVSNTGAAAETPANDLTKASNREPAPEYDAVRGIHDSGKADPAMTFSTADDDPNDPQVDPAYDFDANSVNDDAPSAFTLDKVTGGIAGGTVVKIKGQNFEGVTGVTFGGTAGTALSVKDDENLTVTTPAHAAGAVAVVVTNPTGSKSQAAAFTYA